MKKMLSFFVRTRLVFAGRVSALDAALYSEATADEGGSQKSCEPAKAASRTIRATTVYTTRSLSKRSPPFTKTRPKNTLVDKHPGAQANRRSAKIMNFERPLLSSTRWKTFPAPSDGPRDNDLTQPIRSATS